jgi:sterol desaturase/sphingolipid hydroxylase (fatty acid hydroxylase superfamily)
VTAAPLAVVLDRLREITPVEIKQYYWAAQAVYLDPLFYVLVGAILFVEHIRPAMREQRVFSWALLEDFCWFNLDAVFKVAALPAFIGLLQMAYDRVTGGATIGVLGSWSVPARVMVSLLLFDLLQWFHHWARHKVAVFWHFHVIHHSQRQMNLFTDVRVHAAEYLIAQTLTFIPLFMLDLTPFAIMGVATFTLWYTRFIHANIRMNLGPLKHVLVTPQFHRIHHSIEPRHRDQNFGVLLTVWDRMFGTLYPSYDEYPPTGVEGVRFYPPRDFSPRSWFADLATQFLYPFRQILPGRTTPR